MTNNLDGNYPKDQINYLTSFKYKLVQNDVDSNLVLVYNYIYISLN